MAVLPSPPMAVFPSPTIRARCPGCEFNFKCFLNFFGQIVECPNCSDNLVPSSRTNWTSAAEDEPSSPPSPSNLEEEQPVCVKEVQPACVEVPDPDFYDFDGDRSVASSSFHAGDIWAAYDDSDSMPRYYVKLREVVSTDPLTVSMAFLYPVFTAGTRAEQWAEATKGGYCPSTGTFCDGPYEVREDCLEMFSHKATWEKEPRLKRTGRAVVVRILPRIGEVWALYPVDWEPTKCAEDEMGRGFEPVEVVKEDYGGCVMGAVVVPVGKVAGYTAVYSRGKDGVETVLAGESMWRFSHRVPARLLTGDEGDGTAPKGFWQLDPAAIPPALLKVDGTNKPEAGQDKKGGDDQPEETVEEPVDAERAGPVSVEPAEEGGTEKPEGGQGKEGGDDIREEETVEEPGDDERAGPISGEPAVEEPSFDDWVEDADEEPSLDDWVAEEADEEPSLDDWVAEDTDGFDTQDDKTSSLSKAAAPPDYTAVDQLETKGAGGPPVDGKVEVVAAGDSHLGKLAAADGNVLHETAVKAPDDDKLGSPNSSTNNQPAASGTPLTDEVPVAEGTAAPANISTVHDPAFDQSVCVDQIVDELAADDLVDPDEAGHQHAIDPATHEQAHKDDNTALDEPAVVDPAAVDEPALNSDPAVTGAIADQPRAEKEAASSDKPEVSGGTSGGGDDPAVTSAAADQPTAEEEATSSDKREVSGTSGGDEPAASDDTAVPAVELSFRTKIEQLLSSCSKEKLAALLLSNCPMEKLFALLLHSCPVDKVADVVLDLADTKPDVISTIAAMDTTNEEEEEDIVKVEKCNAGIAGDKGPGVRKRARDNEDAATSGCTCRSRCRFN